MDLAVFWNFRAELTQAFQITALLTAIGIAGSLCLGAAMALAARGSHVAVSVPILFVIDFLRNVPVIVKLFLFYFVFNLAPMTSAALSLVLHQSSYIADTFISGLRSVPREQAESSYSLGLTTPQYARFILLPQLLRQLAAPLKTQFIEVLKNSSVCMVIGIQELTFVTQEIEHRTFKGYEAAFGVTAIYLLLALAISAGTWLFLERKRHSA